MKETFDKEQLEKMSHSELVSLVTSLQEQLDTAKSWWKHHAAQEEELLKKLNGIEDINFD